MNKFFLASLWIPFILSLLYQYYYKLDLLPFSILIFMILFPAFGLIIQSIFKQNICKEIIFIRHVEDTDPKHNKNQSQLISVPDDYYNDRLDPPISHFGLLSCQDGIPQNEIENVQECYRGYKKGLKQVIDKFKAELVITSPLRRAILTACFANQHNDTKIIANPTISEIKSKTGQIKYPNQMKPSSQCVPLQYLKKILHSIPRGKDVDFSLIDKENWVAANEDPETSQKRVRKFIDYIQNRKEKKILVISHGGVIKSLTHHKLEHSQVMYCLFEDKQFKVQNNESYNFEKYAN